MSTIEKSVLSILSLPSKADYKANDLHRTNSWLGVAYETISSSKAEMGLDAEGNMVADGKVLNPLAVLCAAFEPTFNGGFKPSDFADRALFLSEGYAALLQKNTAKKNKADTLAVNPTTGRNAEDYRLSVIKAGISGNLESIAQAVIKFTDMKESDHKVKNLLEILNSIAAQAFPDDKREHYVAILEKENKDKEAFKAILETGATIGNVSDTVWLAKIGMSGMQTTLAAIRDSGFICGDSDISFLPASMEFALRFSKAKPEAEKPLVI